MSDTNRSAIFWTLAGWIKSSAPQVFLDAESAGENDLRSVGYDRVAYYGDDSDIFEVEIWKHKDGHLYVRLCDTNSAQAMFFVSAYEREPFFFEMYPKILSRFAAVRQADAMVSIQKTLTAFVRYGHSTDTIDELGLQTRDDRLRAAASARAFLARNKKD